MITRTPTVPELTPKEIKKITTTVFWHNPPPSTVDVIFIFGASRPSWQDVAELCSKYSGTPIIATGHKDSRTTLPIHEAEVIKQQLIEYGIDKTRIVLENQSRNTLQNVQFGIKTMQQNTIPHNSILFCTKVHHAGRCYRTLVKQLPTSTIYNFGYHKMYTHVEVRKEDWMHHEESRARVYGEFIRIQEYGKQGDIAVVE